MKARIKFRKYGSMKFIGHLDVMRFFQKAMRRAEIPIAFTAGYSPHMIMSFAQPLGVGITSDGEYLDIELTEAISSRQALEQLNQVMVEGIDVVSFVEIPDDKKSSGMTIVAAADYLACPKDGRIPCEWNDKASSFLGQPQIIVWKKTKRSEKEVDIKPMIYQFQIKETGIFLRLATGSVENLKPDLAVEAFLTYLGLDKDQIPMQYHRLEVYADGDGNEKEFHSLESLGNEIILERS